MVWSLGNKILFRFFFCYVILFVFSSQFVFFDLLDIFWSRITHWFSQSILHFEIESSLIGTGSGDTTYNFVLVLIFGLLSVLLTIIWSLIDPKRANYQKLLNGLIVLIRYYLFYQLLIYGMSKLFYLQFRPPSLESLNQPLGEFSPMGLAWNFFGYSKGMVVFTGILELAAGFLLLFKRTVTLGGIFAFALFTYIFALNIFYDIPVKILSLHFLLMSLFLIALDSKRLWNLLVVNKATEPREIQQLFKKAKWIKWKNGIKWSIIIGVVVIFFIRNYNFLNELNQKMENSPLMNTYKVTWFEKKKILSDDNQCACIRWKEIRLGDSDRAIIIQEDGRVKHYFCSFQPENKQILVRTERNAAQTDSLFYLVQETGEIQFTGQLKNDSVQFKCIRRNRSDFNLNRYEFRWINEFPDNR